MERSRLWVHRPVTLSRDTPLQLVRRASSPLQSAPASQIGTLRSLSPSDLRNGSGCGRYTADEPGYQRPPRQGILECGETWRRDVEQITSEVFP